MGGFGVNARCHPQLRFVSGRFDHPALKEMKKDSPNYNEEDR